MIEIRIPNTFVAEREYTLHVLMNVLLGLEYSVQIEDRLDYHFQIEKSELVLGNTFWTMPDDVTYLDEKFLPTAPFFLEHKFAPEGNLPILFGFPEIHCTSEKVHCEFDIIASSFFLLSRWEEYVKKVRDEFDRFPGESSYLQIHDLHYRPLVNEYAEFLWNVFISLGCKQERIDHQFEIIPTHDVDNLQRFGSFFSTMKTVAGDLIIRKNPVTMFRSIREAFRTMTGKQKDPYDSFEKLMTLSDAHKLKSAFYFIPGEKGESDFRYKMSDPFVQKRLELIKRDGHIVGYHASLNTHRDSVQFEKELKRLKLAGFDVKEGRQHYLLFQVPYTWNIWNDAGLKRDLTMTYENDGGFRCGIAREFPVFDILSRKMLSLYERPTIVMERGLWRKHRNPKAFANEFLRLKNIVKKYRGQFTFLWHQDNFERFEWKNYVSVYSDLLID